jgi:hypothetical protein
MDGAKAEEALAGIDPSGLDAAVMLGTGMPSFAPILAHPAPARRR